MCNVYFVLFQLSFVLFCNGQTPSPYVSPISGVSVNTFAGIANVVVDSTGVIYQHDFTNIKKYNFNLSSILWTITVPYVNMNTKQIRDFVLDYNQQKLFVISHGVNNSLALLNIRKYDIQTTASQIWTQDLTNWPEGGSYTVSCSAALSTDYSNLYVSGWAQTSIPLGMVYRLNVTTGVVLASSSVPCSRCQIQRLSLDTSDNIYLSGVVINGNMTVNGTVLVRDRPFLLKLDSNFILQWVATLPVLSYSGTTDAARTMVVVGSSVYQAGITQSGIIGCPDSFTGTTAGFIARYHTNGTLLQSVLIANAGIVYIEKLFLDPMGYLFAVGYTTGNFDNATVTSPVVKMPFFARYDLNLNRQWIYTELSWSYGFSAYVSGAYNIANGDFYGMYNEASYLSRKNHLQYVVSPSPSPSISTSPTSSVTPSTSSSPSCSPTASVSPTSSISPSRTPTPSLSSTPSISPSITPSPSTTPSVSSTPSITPSASSTPSITPSPPNTPSTTCSLSVSSSASVTPTSYPGNSQQNDIPLIVGSVVGTVGGGGIMITVVVVVVFVFKNKKKEGNLIELSLKPDEDRDPEASATLEKIMEKRWKIEYQEIQFPANSQGAFGAVYKATWRNCDCVVKQLNPANYSEHAMKEFLKEASTVQNLRNHRNVCAIFGVCNDPASPICIVMEYVSGGSLKDLVYKSDFQLTTQMLFSFSKDIASGMSHLHQENFLHCDLASRNLLLEKSGSDQYTVKVADFGLTRNSEMSIYVASEGAKFPIRWSAPELLTRKEISRYLLYLICLLFSACDVWSFGVVLWEIAEGKIPYYQWSNEETIKRVCEERTTLLPPARFELPQEILDLMSQCWSYDPSLRPSFDAIFRQLQEMEKKILPPSAIPWQPQQEYQNATYGNVDATSNGTVYSGRDYEPISKPEPTIKESELNEPEEPVRYGNVNQ